MLLAWLIAVCICTLLLAWFLVEKGRRRTHRVSGGLRTGISLPHEAEFELYANAFSHCSRKARLVLAECRIPYKYRPVDLIETGRYETISARYLRINPAGLVPTLLHKGHPVYESDDILTYVADHAAADAPSLVPEDPRTREEMEHWIESGIISSDDPMGQMEHRAGSCIPPLTFPIFITAIRYIPLHRIAVGFLFHPDRKRPAFFTAGKLFGLRRMLRVAPLISVVHAGRDSMRVHLLALAAQLQTSGGPWILGQQYTLADVTWSCILLRVDETGWLDFFGADERLAPVLAYYEALKARPSWADAITAKTHPIIVQAEADLKAAIRSDEHVRAALLHS